jgi:hypothetical protein
LFASLDELAVSDDRQPQPRQRFGGVQLDSGEEVPPGFRGIDLRQANEPQHHVCAGVFGVGLDRRLRCLLGLADFAGSHEQLSHPRLRERAARRKSCCLACRLQRQVELETRLSGIRLRAPGAWRCGGMLRRPFGHFPRLRLVVLDHSDDGQQRVCVAASHTEPEQGFDVRLRFLQPPGAQPLLGALQEAHRARGRVCLIASLIGRRLIDRVGDRRVIQRPLHGIDGLHEQLDRRRLRPAGFQRVALLQAEGAARCVLHLLGEHLALEYRQHRALAAQRHQEFGALDGGVDERGDDAELAREARDEVAHAAWVRCRPDGLEQAGVPGELDDRFVGRLAHGERRALVQANQGLRADRQRRTAARAGVQQVTLAQRGVELAHRRPGLLAAAPDLQCALHRPDARRLHATFRPLGGMCALGHNPRDHSARQPDGQRDTAQVPPCCDQGSIVPIVPVRRRARAAARA